MIVRDLSLKTPEENILLDEILFHLAENGALGETLRFWENKEPCIILGKIGKEEDDVFLERVYEDRIKIIRRCSGGGTVYQGQGCLNYSLVLSKENDKSLISLGQSYQVILSKIMAALKLVGVDAEFMPISDIALKMNHKKISGNAQKRGKSYILHHGTILYDLDLEKIERYLKIPQDVPCYRQGRSHRDFIANIPVGVEDLKSSIKNVFFVEQEDNHLTVIEEKMLQDFLKNKNPLIPSAQFLLA